MTISGRRRTASVAAVMLLSAGPAAAGASAKAAGRWQRLLTAGTNPDRPKRILALAGGDLLVISEQGGLKLNAVRFDAQGNAAPSVTLPGTLDDLSPLSAMATPDGGFTGGSLGPRFVAFDEKLGRTVNKTYEGFQGAKLGEYLLSFISRSADGTYVGLAQSRHALARVTLDGSGNLKSQVRVDGEFAGLNGLGGTALLPDGGLVVTGDTGAAADDAKDLRVIKIDAAGKIVWDQHYGGAKEDYGATVVPTRDGGVLIGGGTRSSGAGGLDWYVVKLDAAGKKQWEQVLGAPSNDFLMRVAERPDGSIVLGGTLGREVALVKLSAVGTVVWKKTYGAGLTVDMALLADGGVALAAAVHLPAAKRSATLVVRTDADGNAGPAPAELVPPGGKEPKAKAKKGAP